MSLFKVLTTLKRVPTLATLSRVQQLIPLQKLDTTHEEEPKPMANSCGLLLAAQLLLVALLLSWSAAEGSGGHSLSWVPTAERCVGSMAKCMAADEFEMDSEINRRILATSQYISYGALQRDTVPCSLRGASYYNCQPGAQANPYNRGCSAIARCRS